MGMPSDRGVTHRVVRRLACGALATGEDDAIVVEEPLSIRIAGETIATTMRTPGQDHLLALGFLFGEGVITRREDVGTIAHCGSPGDEGFGNALEVTPGPGTTLTVDAIRRGQLTTSACGVCGRASIDDLLARCAPLPAGPAIRASMIAEAPAILRAAQPRFARTGASHAAAAITGSGEVLAVHEDVGRHNAVDKVVGQLLLDGRLGDAVLLAVSARAGFEIVQKAVVARIPAVAAVGGPSSLAIDLARASQLTLAGFVRDGRVNVYAGEGRIEQAG